MDVSVLETRDQEALGQLDNARGRAGDGVGHRGTDRRDRGARDGDVHGGGPAVGEKHATPAEDHVRRHAVTSALCRTPPRVLRLLDA